MGLFDTLILDPPIVCPVCGTSHASMQTKALENILLTYKVETLLHCCPVHTGTLKEQIWCCKTEDDQHTVIPVWVVIWHGIYAGAYGDETAAQQRVNSVDRLDLLAWLETAQTERSQWRIRHQRLHRDLENWLEYREQTEEERAESRKSLLGIFHRLPDEIINDADPLKRIVERNGPDEPAGTGGWFDE